MAMEYPSRILNKTFAVQIRALDSIGYISVEDDYLVILAIYKELENWAHSKGDFQLQSLLKLYRYRWDFIKEKTDSNYENTLLEFIKDAYEHKHNYLKAEAIELIAEY
jgi:hypothetical protein